ncbi:MAG TPA: lipase [Actinomycetota bacterium]|nr:lipase [Actinomycetota bacterium]
MRRRRILLSLTVLVASLAAPAARGDSGPPLETAPELLADAVMCPATFTGRSEPVLLVHGTAVTADENWSSYVTALTKRGLDVCTVDLPDRAFGDMQISAEYVVYAVRAIADASGKRVDLVGLSQGGLEPRWAVKWWPDVQARVDDLVDIVTPNHGIDTEGVCMRGCVPSIWQMDENSAFLAALNAGDETPGTIDYTSIYSWTDLIVTPQFPDSTSRLDGATNIAVQEVCPRPVDHVQSAYDSVVYHLVLDAITRVGPANKLRVPLDVCAQPIMENADTVRIALLQALVYPYAFPAVMGITHPAVDAEPPLKEYARS